jgi:predicted RNA-binding Zn-ribbon protein involved in translation (DUF1610 family)
MVRFARVALTLVSAVLCAGSAAVWVRSHIIRDYAFTWLPRPSDAAGARYLKFDLDSGGGQLQLSWKAWTAADRETLRQRNNLAAARFYHRAFDQVPREYERGYPPTAWNAIGFGHYSGVTHSTIWFPYWAAMLATGLGPAVWGVKRIRRRRPREGHCVSCGYSLIGNVSGVCPECGMEVVVRMLVARQKDSRPAL